MLVITCVLNVLGLGALLFYQGFLAQEDLAKGLVAGCSACETVNFSLMMKAEHFQNFKLLVSDLGILTRLAFDGRCVHLLVFKDD